MAVEETGLLRAIWNGPFYIGKLAQPVSIGDVLLKALETLWRALFSIVALLVIGGMCGAIWSEFIAPTFFPPLETQVSAIATYEDGLANSLPAIDGRPSKCPFGYPLKIKLRNYAKKSIGHLNYSIEGKAANRSSNLVVNSNWLSTDVIIPAGRTAIFCSGVSVKEGFDPRELNYTIEVLTATEVR